MRGYDLDEYEDYDDYDEEGSGQEDEYEEEEEQEEAPKPTAEELKYLELRQKLKESYRQKMQKGASGSQDKKKTPDNFGSFFGPSKPVIAQRVIQDTKPLLENQHLAARVLAQQNSKKSSSAPSGSKPAPRPQAPRVSQLKQKVEKMKSTRDYSFLLSEDAELPAPTRKPPPQSVSTPRTEARSAKLSLCGKQTSVANGRPMSKGIEERRSVSSSGHVNPRPGPNKLPSSSKQINVSATRQLNSNGGTGPGRPPVQNGLQSRKLVAPPQKPSLPNGRTAVPTSMKPSASKMQPGTSKHSLEQRRADQRRDPQEANRAEPRKDPYRGEPKRDPRELKRGELRRDPRELKRGEARKDPREPNRVDQRRDSHQPNRGDQRRDSHLPNRADQRRDSHQPNRGDQRRDSHLPNRADQRRDSHQPSRGEPRRDLREPNRAKIPSKAPVSSSKPQIQSQMRKAPQKHMSSQVSSRDQKPKKRLARPVSDDEDEGAMAISMIRKMFGYNPNKYAGRDEDTRDMETGFADLEREEKRSARIAREEDEEQLRLIEEEERRERMRKAKRRKMG